MKDTLIVNMSDPDVKRKLMIEIGGLTGLYEIYLKPRKRTRSLDQNAYYFVAVVEPFMLWLREQYGDSSIDKEQAHEMLKVKILGLQEKQVGDEVLRLIPHSKNLTVEQFGEYIEKCAAWLAEFTGIIVIPPEMFYESAGKKRSQPQPTDQLDNFRKNLVENNE
ncbi:MAG TPA: hypothetical protein VFR78_12455 [Pyrinomonadaceae bacterium]|nr:hypothetical protein [Pyrinomonadaceae bacterium]